MERIYFVKTANGTEAARDCSECGYPFKAQARECPTCGADVSVPSVRAA